ncbi:MAG: gas vesicle protein K [Pseudomonadota bacterium]
MVMERIIETDSPEAFIEEIEKVQDVLPKRIDANPKNVEKGLARLVLTLIELIRKLLEKQAMRRVAGGSLSDEEIEKVGLTLLKLENKMKELKEIFGLKDEELNLNLGPLGDLI